MKLLEIRYVNFSDCNSLNFNYLIFQALEEEVIIQQEQQKEESPPKKKKSSKKAKGKSPEITEVDEEDIAGNFELQSLSFLCLF